MSKNAVGSSVMADVPLGGWRWVERAYLNNLTICSDQ